MDWQRIAIRNAELEVADWGAGAPVVFIQTALVADELLPLASDSSFDGFRKVVYHRRGYGGSSPIAAPRSIVEEAADCIALMEALSLERAHILGYSYSGAVALQLGADAPSRAASLVLLEPPPVHTPSAPDFFAANERLIATRLEQGPAAALDQFMTEVLGPDWREAAEHELPESATPTEADVLTFFDSDLPALLGWQFGREDAARIECPVLHVGGSESGRLFAEVRELVLEWLPRSEDVALEGADHWFPLTHTAATASVIAAFLRRHGVGV